MTVYSGFRLTKPFPFQVEGTESGSELILLDSYDSNLCVFFQVPTRMKGDEEKKKVDLPVYFHPFCQINWDDK